MVTYWYIAVPTTLVLGMVIAVAVRKHWRRQRERRLVAEAAAQQRRIAEEAAAAARLEAAMAFRARIASRLPHPRPILSDREAELYAGSVLAAFGFDEVRVAQRSRDQGVDAEGASVVAQVKFQAAKTAPDKVQQLIGIASMKHKKAVFFSRGGYSDAALRVGEQGTVALFELSEWGIVVGRSSQAVELLLRLGEEVPIHGRSHPVPISSALLASCERPPDVSSAGGSVGQATPPIEIRSPAEPSPPSSATVLARSAVPPQTNIVEPRRRSRVRAESLLPHAVRLQQAAQAIVHADRPCQPGCTYVGPPGTCPDHDSY